MSKPLEEVWALRQNILQVGKSFGVTLQGYKFIYKPWLLAPTVFIKDPKGRCASFLMADCPVSALRALSDEAKNLLQNK